MHKLWDRFCQWNLLLKIIWIFCVLGVLVNSWLICRDFTHTKILLHLHLGFFVLYVGQVVFMLMDERMVFVLSLLQAFMALWTNLDFTFVPFLRIMGYLTFVAHGPFSLDQMEVYKYVFVSICFTCELLKTALLWALLPVSKKK